MPNPCESCDIEEKVYVCCGRYPETGECVDLRVSRDRVVLACRYLDASGRCTIYARRPDQCRRFFCERFSAFKQGFFFF